jgi:outer membrane lipoprotein
MPAFILLALLFLLLGACAGNPVFDTRQLDRSLTPASAATQLKQATGKQVLWGGTILGVTNLAHSTRIELLAYPLDNRGKPQRDEAPLGHFVLEQNGFLEPIYYAEGKLLTVTGTVLRIETGAASESRPGYPVVSATQLYLWPADRFHDDSSLQIGGEVGYGF